MSELYLFERGATKYPYTNGLDSISFGGDTYTPEIISYDRINITDEVFRAQINLSIPVSNELVSVIMNNFTGNVTTLKIYREESLFWAGRVTSSRIIKDNATLICESIYSSIKRLGVKSTYERLCRHALYSDNCGVDKSLYAYLNVEITGINGREITIPAVSGTDDIFKLGMLYNGIEYVTILKRVGDVFTIIKSIDLTVGQLVTLYNGCNHTMDDCHITFDNIINFGGFQFMPSSNIFEVGIL